MVELVASWIRDQRRIQVLPVRLRVSRAGSLVAILAGPWAILIIFGVTWLYSAIGVSVPRIPSVVRIAVVLIALAPAAAVGVAGAARGYGVGLIAGFRWMFALPPTLWMDAKQIGLSVGAQQQWVVAWASIDRLEAMSQPARLAIFRANDPNPVAVPDELLNGRVAGTDVVIDVVGLIATLAPAKAV